MPEQLPNLSSLISKPLNENFLCSSVGFKDLAAAVSLMLTQVGENRLLPQQLCDGLGVPFSQDRVTLPGEQHLLVRQQEERWGSEVVVPCSQEHSSMNHMSSEAEIPV